MDIVGVVLVTSQMKIKTGPVPLKRGFVVAHLCLPAIVAVSVFIAALNREAFGIEMFSTYVFGGFVFYAAPHLLWATVALLSKFSNAVFHAGFIASSIALAAISALWLFPGDGGGLPLQWLLYWPRALVLQILAASFTGLYERVNSKKKALPLTLTNDAADSKT